MTYSATVTTKASSAKIWAVLSDLRHFGQNDPFHHDLKFETEAREGVGAVFSVRHTYAPVFPFVSDKVVCKVVAWESRKELAIDEVNEKRWWMNHSQRFLIEPTRGGGNRLTYQIGHIGVPWILLPLRLWVSWLVLRRMRVKLAEVESAALNF